MKAFLVGTFSQTNPPLLLKTLLAGHQKCYAACKKSEMSSIGDPAQQVKRIGSQGEGNFSWQKISRHVH